MKRMMTLAALAVGSGVGAQTAMAQQIAVSGSIGTTGGSIEAQTQITPIIQLRGGYNYFEYGVDDTYDDIAYDGDLDLTTWGAFVDFRPFANSFIVSAGAYFGDKGLKLAATPTQNVEIGNQTFTPSQVGTLNAEASLEDTAPFLGIGWDTTFQGSGPGMGFKFIVGAMFTGSPDVSMTATGGTLSNDANFQNQLAIEEQNLQDDINDYEIYPVVQAGLTWSF
ncbi:MAG: hypothetical protein Q8R82_07625 [Hyphomonadaceae bacterium]|nr:hypothetical protein [Hyphomonadaceae bacterium]